MSTSDQDGHRQLTRKQLREIRLTGSTPVITEEQAAAASQPTSVLARAADPVEIAPVADVGVRGAVAPLTRRQMRALGYVRVAADERVAEDVVASGQVAGEAEVADERDISDEADIPDKPLVSGVPAFEATPAAARIPRFGSEPELPSVASDREQVAAIFDEPVEEQHPLDESNETEVPQNDIADGDEIEVVTAERPLVGAAFGLGVKPEKSAGALFEDLLDGGSSSGTQHSASTALIFTPSADAGSLSGPIASTGELLITGTYALPSGIGSQGHAPGTADGRDADAVLLDGELAPASSPTPIAASSAVSTSKSAGEVIRPPMPDKSNKLMLTLAIVAGGLALALAATLIIAATTGVFG